MHHIYIWFWPTLGIDCTIPFTLGRPKPYIYIVDDHIFGDISAKKMCFQRVCVFGSVQT